MMHLTSPIAMNRLKSWTLLIIITISTLFGATSCAVDPYHSNSSRSIAPIAVGALVLGGLILAAQHDHRKYKKKRCSKCHHSSCRCHRRSYERRHYDDRSYRDHSRYQKRYRHSDYRPRRCDDSY